MKHICIDARMASCSGIGTYIRNLLLGLKDGPFRLQVIAHPKDVVKWPMLSYFDLILSEDAYYSVKEQMSLPFLIPSCDLFWSPHYNIPLAPIRARKRLVTIHDVYHLAYAHTLGIVKKAYSKTLIHRAVKVSDRIITDSFFSKEELIKYTPVISEKVRVIPLGVDRSLFFPKEYSLLNSIKEKYQLPEKFFLFVSNLAPHKNIRGLLKALDYLNDNWKLVCVGKRVQANDWEKVLQGKEKRALFLGQTEEKDLPFIYQLASVMVHPSFYEGFGLTPLESMSCGCPVVVSNAASLPEVCGDCAIYVDPYNPQDIARGIREMMESPSLREKFKKEGMKRSQTFGWEQTVQKHIETIEKLI